MAGIPAGTLELQIYTDVARLQTQMRDALRSIKGMTDGAQQGAAGMGAAFAKAGQQVTASAGAQRAGMQQLSMQISDVATQFALGAKPMQIFAAQGGQVIQAISLMSGGTSKFATFMGGPWGAALTAATLVAVPLIARMFELEDVTKKVEFASYGLKDAQGILGGVMDLTTGKINTQSAALQALAQAQALAMQIQARARQAEAAATIQGARDLQWQFGGGPVGLSVSRGRSPAAGIVTRFQSGDLTGKDTVKRLDELREAGKLTEKQFLDLAAAVANFGVEGENIKVAEQLARALDGDTRAIQGFLRESKGHVAASKERAAALSEEQKAMKARAEEADRFIASLQREIDEFGKAPKQLREMEVARKAEAAATAVQRAEIIRLGQVREMQIGIKEEADRLQKSLEWRKQTIGALDTELALLGMLGPAREKAALSLEEEAFRADAVKNGVYDVNEAWEEYYQKQLQLINGRSYLEEQRLQAQALEEQLWSLTSALGSLGGIGGKVGGLIGALTSGNPIASVMGLGKAGAAAGILLGGPMGILNLSGGISKGLSSLGLGSGLSGALGAGLAGAGIGGLFGKLVGSGSGGSVGGTLGGLAFGPLGMIGGGLLGGLLGSVFGSTPKGKATFSGGLSYALSGGSASRQQQAGGFADSVLGSLQQVADALGADLGGFTGTIGVRGKNLRYDPTGQGNTKTSKGALDFGKDEAALLEAVFNDAISDGVFKGLSEGVERLLKGEGGVDERIQKALSFQSALDYISSFKDPLGTALTAFDKQMQKVRDLFTEAGASAEQFADLDAYSAAERQKVISQYSQASEDERQIRQIEIEIMRLQGDEIGALNEERRQEMVGVSASVKAALERRNALIDEAIAAEQARAAADERRQLEYRMAQVLGDEEKILTMRREDELAAVSDLNKVYLQQVHAAEAAAAAVAKAAAAQNAAVSSLQGLPGMIGGGVLGAAGNPAVMSALGMFAGGDVTGARNALASYISNTVGTALPGATSAVQSAAIDQVIASLSPSGPVNIGRGVTTGQLGGNKKPAGNLSDGKLAQSFADAEAARVDKLDDLHSRLADAYDREKKALEDLVEPFRKVREELIAYKEDLLGGMRSPGQTLQSLQVKLMAAAASKDASVLATIPGLGRDFDSLARSRSSTKADYMRQQAFLVGIVDQAIGTAGGEVNYNEEQLQRLDKSVDLQIEIKKEQETTNDLLRQLLDENKGERSEQLQLGLKIEQWTHGAHKALRGATRGGNTMEVELDA